MASLSDLVFEVQIKVENSIRSFLVMFSQVADVYQLYVVFTPFNANEMTFNLCIKLNGNDYNITLSEDLEYDEIVRCADICRQHVQVAAHTNILPIQYKKEVEVFANLYKGYTINGLLFSMKKEVGIELFRRLMLLKNQ